MAICEFSDTCEYFKEEFNYNYNDYKYLCSTFCNGHFATCARYKTALSQGITNVPPDLLPDPLKCLKCFADCDLWN